MATHLTTSDLPTRTAARRLHAVVVLLIGELAGDLPGRRLSARAMDRWVMRTWCVLRYGQLRRSRGRQGALNPAIVRQVDREARQIDAGWKLSARALQEWTHAMVAAGGDLGGLLHPHVRPGRDPRGVRCPRRSPEAVDHFRRVYVDARGQRLARCHALTLEEAKRRGWLWPASPRSTAAWVRRGGLRIQRGL